MTTKVDVSSLSSQAAAELIRGFSYLIADSTSSNYNHRQRLDLISFYPLHKPQILGYLDSISGEVLSYFYNQVVLDDDLKLALVRAVERIGAMVTNERDIVNLWAVIRKIALYDRQWAVEFAKNIDDLVARGEITGERARNSSRHLLDHAIAGPDYIATMTDTDLLELILYHESENVQHALAELLRRDHPIATVLVAASPVDLIKSHIPPFLLRSIYTQKLLANDFVSWVGSFKTDNDLALKQAEFSVYEACVRGNFDANNQTFIDLVGGLRHDRFFGVIRDLVRHNIPLNPQLDDEAWQRLTYLLDDPIRLHIKEYVDLSGYVEWLCRIHPERAQNLWEKAIPIGHKIFESYHPYCEASMLIKSLLEGFAPLIITDQTKIDQLGSSNPKVDHKWQEIRNIIFWKMILIAPSNGEEITRKLYANVFGIMLNGDYGLVDTIGIRFNEEDKQQLLKLESVQALIKRLVLDRQIEGSNIVIHLLNNIIQPEIIKTMETLKSIQLDYTFDEAYFVNYFMPSLVNGNKEDVKAKIDQLRTIRAYCREENSKKHPDWRLNDQQESEFWFINQIWLAILMDIAPELVGSIVSENMGNERGYHHLKPNLRLYGQIAYHAQDTEFTKSFYDLCKTDAQQEIWGTILGRYKLRQIVHLSRTELENLISVAAEWTT